MSDDPKMNIRMSISIFSSVIFFIITSIFGIVLYRHISERNFSYSYIDVPVRPGTEGMPDAISPRAGQQTMTMAGPNGVKSQTYIMGMSVDAPLHHFANDFNNHIDNLNEQFKSENTLLITLDIIGLLASAVSFALELRKSF